MIEILVSISIILILYVWLYFVLSKPDKSFTLYLSDEKVPPEKIALHYPKAGDVLTYDEVLAVYTNKSVN